MSNDGSKSIEISDEEQEELANQRQEEEDRRRNVSMDLFRDQISTIVQSQVAHEMKNISDKIQQQLSTALTEHLNQLSTQIISSQANTASHASSSSQSNEKNLSQPRIC